MFPHVSQRGVMTCLTCVLCNERLPFPSRQALLSNEQCLEYFVGNAIQMFVLSKISSKTGPKRCVSDFPFEEYFVANTYQLLVEYDAMFFAEMPTFQMLK